MRIVVEHPPEREKAKRSQPPGRELWLHKVRGQLVAHKLIEGQVFVESANDVITVGIGVRPHGILSVKQHEVFRIRVARHVEPMPSPTFAVTR